MSGWNPAIAIGVSNHSPHRFESTHGRLNVWISTCICLSFSLECIRHSCTDRWNDLNITPAVYTQTYIYIHLYSAAWDCVLVCPVHDELIAIAWSPHLYLADLHLVRSPHQWRFDVCIKGTKTGQLRVGSIVALGATPWHHIVPRHFTIELSQCLRWCPWSSFHLSGWHSALSQVVCCQRATGPFSSQSTWGLL